MTHENTCRRCSECVGMSHHWTPDPLDPNDDEDIWEPGDYACKHCDQRGNVCPNCEEQGCEECDNEGVIPLTEEEYAHEMQLRVEGDWP